MAAPRMPQTDPCTLAKAFQTLEFPAPKQELVECAETQRLMPEMMQLLQQIPDREYQNLADVFKAIGQVEGG